MMDHGLWAWIGLTAVGVTLLLAVWLAYFAVVLAWEEQRTRGTSYYGLPPAERDLFKRRLRFHARALFPVLRVTGRLSRVTFANASFRFHGVSGPKGSCTLTSFERGHGHEPRASDVFVVTQMKCGTTWMQHLVYQILLRGGGELAESGRTLYAVSPWLEAVKSVSVDEAPNVGEARPSRIIKTHFPVSLCPFSMDAKYVYVARHPVSCFASCADFIAANLGAFAPDVRHIEEWFCSDESMWWRSWPTHVEGWWKRSRTHRNVLFVQFEDMKRDLAAVAREVTAFLDLEPLRDGELAAVVEKCSFEYMRRHQAAFEMHPPHILAVDAELFVRGTSDRYLDVSDEVRQRVMRWCTDEMSGAEFPLEAVYPAPNAVRGVKD